MKKWKKVLYGVGLGLALWYAGSGYLIPKAREMAVERGIIEKREADIRRNIDEVLNGKRKVIIEVGAEWCNPCRQLRQILEEYAKKKDIEIRYIDFSKPEKMDEYSKILERNGLKIEAIPSLLVLGDENNKITVYSGYSRKGTMKNQETGEEKKLEQILELK